MGTVWASTVEGLFPFKTSSPKKPPGPEERVSYVDLFKDCTYVSVVSVVHWRPRKEGAGRCLLFSELSYLSSHYC